MAERVYCLYRVSTNKQVDHDENNQADIPMQRKACHDFAAKMGWVIVGEEQETGVSGYKVSADAVINCSSSRSMRSRASSIFCLSSCSTDWAASQMKHPSLWSGLLKRASASGAYRKESSGLSPTRTA